MGWRVEIELSSDPSFADEPYEPAPLRLDARPAPRGAGTAATCTSTRSTPRSGDATMTETFGFGFKPLSEGGGGLDFITLSDYVVPTAGGRSAAASPSIRAS